MGYTTDFEGSFTLNKSLAPNHKAYLDKFAETRRMCRDAVAVASLADPVRGSVGLGVGPDGCYFVGGGGFAGQERDASIIDYNRPPAGQPCLWCKWAPNEAATAIEWTGAEKFYNYVEWLGYLVDHFLKPWGYAITGTVHWEGEERSDVGRIIALDNVIAVATLAPSTTWQPATTGGR